MRKRGLMTQVIIKLSELLPPLSEEERKELNKDTTQSPFFRYGVKECLFLILSCLNIF